MLIEAFNTWRNYGRALIPILQGNASIEEQREAHAVATQRFGAKAISWWPYGVIGQWDIVNTPVDIDTTSTDPTEAPPPGTQFGEETIILPGEAGYRSIRQPVL